MKLHPDSITTIKQFQSTHDRLRATMMSVHTLSGRRCRRCGANQINESMILSAMTLNRPMCYGRGWRDDDVEGKNQQNIDSPFGCSFSAWNHTSVKAKKKRVSLVYDSLNDSFSCKMFLRNWKSNLMLIGRTLFFFEKKNCSSAPPLSKKKPLEAKIEFHEIPRNQQNFCVG